jgi:protocatechuate 3,4-dioxygenase beta subunit
MERPEILSNPLGIRETEDPTAPPNINDMGLQFDVGTLLSQRSVSRRQAIRYLGLAGVGGGLMALVGCALDGNSSASASAGGTSAASAGASVAASAAASGSLDRIPEETSGPYPGDGSNGPDILNQSGVVRGDIRSSFGGASGTAQGAPLTVKLLLQQVASGGAPYAGAAVYLWHCDREGRYSLYSNGVTDQNYLRGVQAANADGVVTFTTIFPGCYSGRWPHIHFEVYPGLASATDVANKIATSQIALPKNACDTVYATSGYEASVGNLAGVSLQTDNVFGNDAGVHQIGTVSGNVSGGFVVTLPVPV